MSEKIQNHDKHNGNKYFQKKDFLLMMLRGREGREAAGFPRSACSVIVSNKLCLKHEYQCNIATTRSISFF